MRYETESLPISIVEMIGTKKKIKGHVFSKRSSIPETEFEILDARISQKRIFNFVTQAEYGAFELLVKNDNMPKSKWTCAFPSKEIE